MKIKVCGMKDPGNIKEVSQLPIDYMGFIFYKFSPRYIEELNPDIFSEIPASIQKIGVFVNEDSKKVQKITLRYQLSLVQLHGEESPEYCQKLKQNELKVIKAFSFSTDHFEMIIKDYEEVCDFFLFDTHTPLRGGSGKKFDWEILHSYKGEIPFFLSGGITPGDKERIRQFHHPLFYGIDLNSRFEIEPGKKNIQKLKQLIL
jgi:Phosphoribosylanthranilate isomerase